MVATKYKINNLFYGIMDINRFILTIDQFILYIKDIIGAYNKSYITYIKVPVKHRQS